MFFTVVLQGHVFTISTELMKNVEEDVTSEEGPFYTFSGFNVSAAGGSLPHACFVTEQHCSLLVLLANSVLPRLLSYDSFAELLPTVQFRVTLKTW